jgi:hypothetical protein
MNNLSENKGGMPAINGVKLLYLPKCCLFTMVLYGRETLFFIMQDNHGGRTNK